MKNKTRCPLLPILFNIVLEILAIVIRKGKEIKAIQTVKKKVKLSLFANDMILRLENPKDTTRNLFELINEFDIKSQDTKLIHRNQLHFYSLTMKDRKEKSGKPSHLSSHQRE